MERLTKCVGFVNGKPIYTTNIDMRKLGAVDELKNALGRYEDLEEQGLLLKLPCRSGDVIYSIESGEPRPYIASLFRTLGSSCDSMAVIDVEGRYLGIVGITVFATKEDAEQKIKDTNDLVEKLMLELERTEAGRA